MSRRGRRPGLWGLQRSGDRSGGGVGGPGTVPGRNRCSHAGNTHVTMRKRPTLHPVGGRANSCRGLGGPGSQVMPRPWRGAPGRIDHTKGALAVLGAAAHLVPYPSWLNTGDNTWQVTAATFVGLMSLPGLAVLYASIVQKKWAVNVLAMMFAGFSLVLIAWVLWSYKMGFGSTSIGGGVHNGVQTQLTGDGGVKHFFENFVGKPGQIMQPRRNRARPCRRPTPRSPSTSRPRRWPTSSSSSPPSLRCCSWGACSAGSSSAPGASWCRCGRPSSTASTPSCCGAAATSPRKGRSTSPAAMSSTCRPGCRASWPPGSSDHGSCEIAQRLTQQPGHGGRRGRHPVARLERLQRW